MSLPAARIPEGAQNGAELGSSKMPPPSPPPPSPPPPSSHRWRAAAAAISAARWCASTAAAAAPAGAVGACAFWPNLPPPRAPPCRRRPPPVVVVAALGSSAEDDRYFGEEGGESSILEPSGRLPDGPPPFPPGGGGAVPGAGGAPASAASGRLTSIIDDGHGHVNPELAQSIWEWENEHLLAQTEGGGGEEEGSEEEEGGGDGGKKKKDAPMFPAARLKFSTRAGLRIVDEIARELLSAAAESESSSTSSSSSGGPSSSAAASDDSGGSFSEAPSSVVSSAGGGACVSHGDLIQEGTIALMRAMARYDPSLPDAFEVYARRKIRRAMSRALADTARPLRLPSRVHDVLRSARREARRLRSELGGADGGGREPTLEEIAAAVRVPPERLRFYGLVGRNAVPVESTVEIYDPDSPSGDVLAFADEDAYETVTGKDEARLHSGEQDLTEEEEEWVEPHDKIVAPLRDFIPDTASPPPDDAALADIMRSDIDDLLTKTLDERELAVIRMRFGIASDSSDAAAAAAASSSSSSSSAAPMGGKTDHPVYREGMTFTEIGAHLGISRQRAAQIEQRALEKLRESYSSVFVEQYLDDDHSAEVSI